MAKFTPANHLLALGLMLLTGCSSDLITGEIDPAGHLSRSDYLALRERGAPKDPKEKISSSQDVAKLFADPPPIPDMPTQLGARTKIKNTEKPMAKERRVSVNVTDTVPLRDVLMELAREGHVNLELDPRVQGGIIFTAHNQPFHEVLQHICALAGLRYKNEDGYLRIELDEPYQQNYPVDYLSLSRRTTSEVGISTNVFDVDVSNGSSSGSSARSNSGSATENNSTARIAGVAEADFWSELEKSLTQVLATTSRNKPMAVTQTAASSNANFSIDRQAGIVTVFGNSRQQEAVETYLKKIQHKASSQVLIEARIVEVELNDEFKSGINWTSVFKSGAELAAKFNPMAAATEGVFSATLNRKDLTNVLSLVRNFGTTRILSAPRLTVLNNQTAVLKVARNEVYFVTSAQYPTVTNLNGVTTTTGTPVFSSTPRTVPVGLVMTVQPAIDNERQRVTMTLRPTISRVVDHVEDPSIGLNAAAANQTSPTHSFIPVLAVREMDSVLQLKSGEIAIMGGLMQDSSQNQDQGVPPFDALPVVGNLAKSRDNQGNTSELVILLRATIMDNPAPDVADGALYRRYNNDPRPLPLPTPPETEEDM